MSSRAYSFWDRAEICCPGCQRVRGPRRLLLCHSGGNILLFYWYLKSTRNRHLDFQYDPNHELGSYTPRGDLFFMFVFIKPKRIAINPKP